MPSVKALSLAYSIWSHSCSSVISNPNTPGMKRRLRALAPAVLILLVGVGLIASFAAVWQDDADIKHICAAEGSLAKDFLDAADRDEMDLDRLIAILNNQPPPKPHPTCPVRLTANKH